MMDTDCNHKFWVEMHKYQRVFLEDCSLFRSNKKLFYNNGLNMSYTLEMAGHQLASGKLRSPVWVYTQSMMDAVRVSILPYIKQI